MRTFRFFHSPILLGGLLLAGIFCNVALAQKKRPAPKPSKPAPKKPASKATAAEPIVAAGNLTATTLRCEYLVNPLTVETNAPRLSWLVESNDRGAAQTAYQIIVASTTALLNANKGDLWDSTKIASNQQNQIEYQGKQLASRQQAFWKVRLWDQSGKASAWSQAAHWTQGMANWSAQWIGDSTPSKENVATTLLRREFKIAPRNKATLKRAILYASALGVYELRINGQRVGDAILAPEYTDYLQRTQYQAYDVTALLKIGDNAIAATLGDGWYAGGIGLAEILIQQPRNVYGSHLRLLAQLDLEMTNGDEERIASDSQWNVTREGPIRSSDLLMGETYDARREMPGWDKPGFHNKTWDGKEWAKADALAVVNTKLYAQINEPIRITRTVKPLAITEPKRGVYVFDLGQNMVGWVRLQMQGAAGAVVKLQHAEMLNPDGTIYTENLRAAKQIDQYTLRGGGIESFEPHFTYHGFRYVQVTGLAAKPQLSDLLGQQFNSDMRETSKFESSSPLLNQLWRNILWTQRDNMHSIPTDCPQRDERMGWTGDIQIFVGTGIFNMDMAAFFTKWLRDLRDAQTPDGRFPDFAPQPFQKTLEAMKKGDFMGVAGWADAGVVVPWRMYQQYGDKRILAENYDAAKRWVEFIRQNNPDLLWKLKRGNDYGDWLNADTMKAPASMGIPAKGGEVPKEVFATMMFAYATELVSKMATVLDKQADAAQYTKLHGDIKAAFNKAYVAADGKLTGNTQAGYAIALHFNLLPESKRAAALKFMLDGIKAYKGHMSTGFHSTYRMMLELSNAGQNDIAYQLINQTSFPSWGYSIEQGATTIWERWDGYVKGRGFADKGMNSFNHYAIGAVGEWMMRTIVGINQDDAKPAYEHFTIHPRPGGGLTAAKGAYDSIRGKIEASWRSENGTFKLDVTIPANTSATVSLPSSASATVTESGKPVRDAVGVKIVNQTTLEVGAGKYSFEVSP